MNNKTRILVAGIGNIFLGDDAFGVEVVRELAKRVLPDEVEVIDFGIRSYDLAYALTDSYEVIVLVDAVPRAEPAGTLYLIEPDLNAWTGPETPDGHSLDPVAVLRMAQTLGGGISAIVYLIGCEPSPLEDPNGEMRLSGPVQAAVPQALELIESLICRWLNLQPKTTAGSVPV